MRDEYWPLADAVARDLAGRADPNELAHVAHYLSEHRDADDFFALLDELAGPGGAALARSGQTGLHQSAVRDACQRLRELPAADLPAVVGWAARLLRYQQSQLPAPRPLPAARVGPPGRPAPRPGGPPAVAGAPAVGGPPAARPAGPPPGRPQPPRPGVPGPARPAAAAERGPGAAPTGPGGPPPARPGAPPAERGPVRPAAQQPPPPPAPRRPPTMEDMLRQLQEQFGGGRGATESRPPAGRPEPRESKRERLRREQEAIRERYRQQREGDEPE